MINSTEILNAQKHTVFLITLMITSAIYLYFVKQDPLLVQDKWMKQTIALLIGAVIYDLLLSKVTTFILDNANVHNKKIKQVVTDIALWSTIFGSLELAESYMDNREFNANQIFLKERGAMIGVYVLYDLFIEDSVRSLVPNVNNNQDLVSDIIKNGLAVYVGVTVRKNKFNHYSEIIIVIGAFLMYYLFTKNLIITEKSLVTPVIVNKN
jgi:hypothetical protein